MWYLQDAEGPTAVYGCDWRILFLASRESDDQDSSLRHRGVRGSPDCSLRGLKGVELRGLPYLSSVHEDVRFVFFFLHRTKRRRVSSLSLFRASETLHGRRLRNCARRRVCSSPELPGRRAPDGGLPRPVARVWCRVLAGAGRDVTACVHGGMVLLPFGRFTQVANFVSVRSAPGSCRCSPRLSMTTSSSSERVHVYLCIHACSLVMGCFLRLRALCLSFLSKQPRGCAFLHLGKRGLLKASLSIFLVPCSLLAGRRCVPVLSLADVLLWVSRERDGENLRAEYPGIVVVVTVRANERRKSTG